MSVVSSNPRVQAAATAIARLSDVNLAQGQCTRATRRVIMGHAKAALKAADAVDPLRVSCECGAMQAGRVESCKLHPDVRLRTREEMSDFAKAFDASIEGTISEYKPEGEEALRKAVFELMDLEDKVGLK